MISWLNWGDEITTETIRKAYAEAESRELERHKILCKAEGLHMLAYQEKWARHFKEQSNALVIQASPLGRI